MKLNFINQDILSRLQFYGYNEPHKLTSWDCLRWLEENYALHLSIFPLMDVKTNKFTGYSYDLCGENDCNQLIGLYSFDEDEHPKMAKTLDDVAKLAVAKVFKDDEIHKYMVNMKIAKG